MSELEPDPSKDVHGATTSRDQQLPIEPFSQGEQEELFIRRIGFSAHVRAYKCWGSEYEGLWKNETHMGILYDKLPLVKKTLLESTDILCDNLKPDDILRSMKSKGALTQDDVTEIKKQTTVTEQVDKLLEVLMRKPVSAYNTFMDILQKERPDLHRQIKTIEKRQSLKRKHNVEEEKISYQYYSSGPGVYYTLSDRDIEDIVDVLKPNELTRLYKKLHITSEETEEAIQENQENMDPKEKARIIFRYWRENNGLEATRQKILDALIACSLKYKALVLGKQWGAEIKDPP